MCNYDDEDLFISEKVAYRAGDAVKQIVEDLLSAETNALEARVQEYEKRVIAYQNNVYEMLRTIRQLEHDSGKPYMEQNKEIQRLNSHVANLQAAVVENEELRAALREKDNRIEVLKDNIYWEEMWKKEAWEEVRRLKLKLKNCAYWSSPLVYQSETYALVVIHDEATEGESLEEKTNAP